jgi:hypothetical protein
VKVLGLTNRNYVNPAHTEVCGGSIFDDEDGDDDALRAMCGTFSLLPGHLYVHGASTSWHAYACTLHSDNAVPKAPSLPN